MGLAASCLEDEPAVGVEPFDFALEGAYSGLFADKGEFARKGGKKWFEPFGLEEDKI